MGVSGSIGNFSTILTKTAVGIINCNNGSFTGTGKPTTPTAAGVFIGLDTTAAAGIELCSTSLQYVDFTVPSSEFKGR